MQCGHRWIFINLLWTFYECGKQMKDSQVGVYFSTCMRLNCITGKKKKLMRFSLIFHNLNQKFRTRFETFWVETGIKAPHQHVFVFDNDHHIIKIINEQKNEIKLLEWQVEGTNTCTYLCFRWWTTNEMNKLNPNYKTKH